jgi:hypothetical protein
MMDFFTLDSTKSALKPQGLLCRWARGLSLGLLLVWLAPLQAQTPAPSGVVVERTTDHLLLSTRVSEPLPLAVQEALNKGVALYFVWTAEVQSPRWYFWRDTTHSRSVRTLRLAYQGLSGHWRLSWSNDSVTSGGWRNAVHQNHDSLDQAWAAVGRMLKWPVAQAKDIPTKDAWLNVTFALDLGLLPRPFQLGLGNQDDWTLERNYRLPVPAVGMTLESRHGW